mmetsp:Transcript_9621/g.18300  ORF Transcript_9621/g.18300 Transcript_9621/m.18300 type:complete len:374 (+) Transcript_9621:3-1124(+)
MGQLRRNKKVWAGDVNCTDRRRVDTFKQGRKKVQGGYDRAVKGGGDLYSFANEKLPRSLRDLQNGMANNAKKVKGGAGASKKKRANAKNQDSRNGGVDGGKGSDGANTRSNEEEGESRQEAETNGSAQKKKKTKKKKKPNEQSNEEEVVLKEGDKYEFQSKIRPGESFRKYSARIGREKRAVLVAQASKLTKLSSKRKAFLNSRKEAAKDKKQEIKEQASFATKAAKYQIKDEEAKKRALAEPETPTDSVQVRQPPKKKFKKVDKVVFGEVADRPPDLLVRPKRKKTPAELMAELTGQGSVKEQQKKQLMVQGEDKAARAAKMQQQMRMIQLLKERSQEAYKQAKLKRKHVMVKGGKSSRKETSQKFVGLNDM